MTVLAADWLSISINLLLFVFVIVCILMSMIILMQRPKNEGLGAAFGSGTTDQLFGARTTNVLQKATVYLATLFFVLTLALAVMIGKKNSAERKTLVAEVVAPVPEVTETPAPVAEKPLESEAVTPPVQVPAEPAAPAETPADANVEAPAETPAEPATPAEPVTPATPAEPAEPAEATPPPAEAPAEPAPPADGTPPEQP